MINDYVFAMDDSHILTAEPTVKTMDRLTSMSAAFLKQIMLHEERVIIQNLPNDALLRLKETVLECCEVRGLL